MNVLVVDDEPIIRLGLRTLVEWERHGFRYAGESEDGLDAWDTICAADIDIVITDLLMPRMDGLELIRKIKEHGKEIGVVVLSCMDDFSYVKEAMKLGAKDYMLKPTMEPEALLSALQGIRSELEKVREERAQISRWRQELAATKQAQLGGRLWSCLQTGQEEAELEEELFGGASPGGLCSILLHTGGAVLDGAQDWSWTGCLAVLPAADDGVVLVAQTDSAGCGASGAGSSADAGTAPAPPGAPSASASGAARAAQTLAEAAARCFAQLPAPEPPWFVGAGLPLRSLADLRRALRRHERQAHARFYSGEAARLMLDDPGAPGEPGARTEAPTGPPPGPGALPHDGRSDLLRCIASGNTDGFLHQAAELAVQLQQRQPPKDMLLPFVQELLALAAGYARERGYDGIDEFEETYVNDKKALACSSFKEVRAHLLQAFQLLAARRGGAVGALGLRAHNPFIRKALQFMQEHYATHIGTLDIAEHVRLSRSYLSDLYSKEMGESLSESLTRIRIEEAKLRLRSGDMKIYEVAEAVGFQDPKAFAKTFKRVVGCSPKEYERSNK